MLMGVLMAVGMVANKGKIMNESLKTALANFINATINKDDVAAKTAFNSYAQDKAKELDSLRNGNKPIAEQTIQLINEKLDVGHGFTFDGPSVFFHGKHIGRFENVGQDEFGEGNTMQYVDDDGETFELPDNTVPPLVEFLRKKYLGDKE